MAKVVKTTVTQEPIHGGPAPNMVRVYGKDGSEQDMYPVDAKEAVALGEYSYEPTALLAGKSDKDATGEPPPDFEAMTKADLEDYAAKHNIAVTTSMTKAEQIDAIRAGSK
jgi:hypothetical protein